MSIYAQYCCTLPGYVILLYQNLFKTYYRFYTRAAESNESVRDHYCISTTQSVLGIIRDYFTVIVYQSPSKGTLLV